MRKLLNTLYVTTEGAYLSTEGENVLVKAGGEVKLRVPFCNLEGIVCFSYVGASPALMGKCAEQNIALCFLSPDGKFLARVTGPTYGNVHLRRAQFRLFDREDETLELAKSVIGAKIHNQRMILFRALKDHPDTPDTDGLREVVAILTASIEEVKRCPNAERLRGIEGESARMYYMAFGRLIRNPDFNFSGRCKRPPLDEVNAMLSYLYTLMGMEVQSALEMVGLDPYVGIFHTDRSGRASLALDILEEFRAPMVDRTVLSMINRGQIKKSDFTRKEGGAVLFSDEGKKKTLQCWHDRKTESMVHPVIGERVQCGLLPYVQSQLMAKRIRGDTACYTPYVWS